MTARKTREARTVATEDAFGTPPAARGSMMAVAGAEDELPAGEELLTDDGEAMGPTEGRVVRISLGELRRLLRRETTGGR
jgi:hypothetical protein